MAIAELDSMIKEAKAGKRIRRNVSLVEPMDQTAEYDGAITRLEMSCEDIIELDDSDFNRYVLNNWHWAAQFSASNRLYSDKA